MATDEGLRCGQGPGPTVICLGETMLMFAPPPGETIEYCQHFTAFNGGAESNVAIGLERLGVHAGWVSKLPRNALARKVVNEIRSFGVDTTGVVWADQGRVGLFFVEWGARPRPIATIYDRAGSAATTLTADELDWQYLSQASWLHLTGITPALGENSRRVTFDIAKRAHEAGMKISFDLNYRSLLWSQEAARNTLGEILTAVDMLVATESDAAIISGRKLSREDALRWAVDRYPVEAAVMTLGDEGSIAFDRSRFYRSQGYPVQAVNRLGAGDAFVSGLLYGYLRSGLQAGLDYGGAMAALKLTVPQNIPIVNKEDVERLLSNRSQDLIR